MRTLILGYDGYLGWPLTQELLKQNHELILVDNYSRRRRVKNIGSKSLSPINEENRNNFIYENRKQILDTAIITLGHDSQPIYQILREYEPDTIIHFAEQPSAPWSMKDVNCASITQIHNIIGTLHLLWAMRKHTPNAHLVKIGTMGEYGTPNCDIPEGFIPESCLNTDKMSCPMQGTLFPRDPGSFYHLTKVHDTYNIYFACKTWGLRSTDIMQGVVYGISVGPIQDEVEFTRFDYDEYFGTAINRFIAQSLIEHPLTIYGKGKQQRGFLPLKDSIQCIQLAINKPPNLGEYRTWNQFEKVYSINDLALLVQNAANVYGLKPEIEFLENPRTEALNHYYNPSHDILPNLGYRPELDIEGEILYTIETLLPHKGRIIPEVIRPKTTWR